MGIPNCKSYSEHMNERIDKHNNTIHDKHNNIIHENQKQNINISYFLSMSMLIIKHDSTPFLCEKTLVSTNGQENWRVTIILHKDLVNYIRDSNLSVEIIFKDQHNFNNHALESKLLRKNDIENTNFTSYSFCCKRPIRYGYIFNIYITLQNSEHYMFDVATFKNNIPIEKQFAKKSYYEIFITGLNEFNEDEFTKYWALCINDINNVSIVTHYTVSKNDINEEVIVNDPLFALFSVCDDEDIDFWIETLELFNCHVDWKKLCNISRNFYKKFKYQHKHIIKGVQQLTNTISYSASVIDHIDVNILGNICEKIYKYNQKNNLQLGSE